MSEEPQKNYPKALLFLGMMAAFPILVVIGGLVRGSIVSGKNSTVTLTGNPDAFNTQLGLWMLFAAITVIAWFVVFIKMLKERRDRLDRAADEGRGDADQA